MTRSPPPSAYDDDFYAWTQEQAAALRRLPGDAVGDMVDVAHLAEEIEDLGKRDLREVTSYLGQVLEHLIKINSVPESKDVTHWRMEVLQFGGSAADAFTPGMRQLIDLESLWTRSLKRASRALAEAGATLSAPLAQPFSLDDLLSEDLDVDLMLKRLKAPPP